MAGMWGTFGDVKRITVVVLILLAVAFGLGYCNGYEAGKGKSSDDDDMSKVLLR